MPVAPVSQIKASVKVEPEEQVERLRTLLLGPEADQVIQRLVEKDQTTLVTEVISEALEQRASKDDSLAQSLSSVVDAAIDTSIKEHPDRITNVIFPVMGPAIRKAVAAALQDMVQNLNQVLSEGLSFRSWRWRFQAWRAGKSYAEYVLIKSLQYRVEQVLLIHRETGLLLQDVCVPQIAREDPELVSAMLTAINDFACDAFHKDQQQCIDHIRFGEYTLIIVAGPFAMLAGAVRGTPAAEVTTKLSEIIEKIHLDHASLLVGFDGDKTQLEPVQGLLKTGLLQKEAQRGRSVPWLAYGFIALAVVGMGLWITRTYQVYDQQRQVMQALEQQGMVILDQKRVGRSLQLVTLRSEADPSPQAILGQLDLTGFQVRVEDRVIPVVEKPIPVAEPSPRQQAIAQWQQTVAELQGMRLHFQSASSKLVAEDSAVLASMVVKANSLADLAEPAGVTDYQLILTGFADGTGNEATNRQLSRERAQVVFEQLQANGVVAEKVLLWGLGALPASELDGDEQRIVSMQVLYDQ
ncbi:MAG: hypothetical protein CMK89_11105 [Pseudomonadales bacterium]|nr:hypothetical protein [Pseudomonadales bacterium]